MAMSCHLMYCIAYAFVMTQRDSYSIPKTRLGLEIARLRDQKGMSQRQFALYLGLDRVTLNRIESGTGNPTLETLIRIAQGLDVDLEDLF